MEILERIRKAIGDHSELEDASIRDAGQFGASGGFAGFIFYTDTAEFYDKNEELLWELLEEQAESMGVKPLELVSNFNTEVHSIKDFKNIMAWFALEEVGRYLTDQLEETEAN